VNSREIGCATTTATQRAALTAARNESGRRRDARRPTIYFAKREGADMNDENEAVAIAMFEAENKIDGNVIIGWEDQPPVYKERMLAMARAAILKMRVLKIVE
jgi:hypothetical protein